MGALLNYYHVRPADHRYRGNKPLTYQSTDQLATGTVVVIPLRNRPTLGLIVKKLGATPKMPTKPITRIVADTAFPDWCLEFMQLMSAYYPAAPGDIAQLLIPSSLRAAQKATASQDLVAADTIPKQIKPHLTKEQQTAYQAITSSKQSSVLLHGVTGSGKTRLYVELVKDALLRGRSAIVLTPEIGLTPQLEESMLMHFGNRVLVSHSNLSAAKRRDMWLRILKAEEPLVILGPRSALFYPLKQIGIIVIDEAHDSSYKQEQAPHYHATRTAALLAKVHGCPLILGTATPNISDYHTFQTKQLPIIQLKQQALTGQQATVEPSVIDTKDRTQFTRSPWLANDLLNAIEQTLKRQEQTLIYLNRRGTARVILCGDCGWQAQCESCESNLVYHADQHAIVCHYCGKQHAVPSACAQCGSSDVLFRSAGTKFIAEELARYFPQANIGRFDSDNQSSNHLTTRYDLLRDGSIDILVGTQVISKGLDLPRLATLGILQADNALSLPDYVAEEMVFQQIYQLLGRVGRGHRGGSAYIQTQQADHYAIQAALNRDYDGFYTAAIAQRKAHQLPPFRHLLKISCERASRTSAQQALSQQKATLQKSCPKLKILGPAPLFQEKVRGKFRWQLIIKAQQRGTLLDIARTLPANLRHDIDPVRLL